MDISILYLQKANADLVCHCECSIADIAFPAQLDCPWCGCGWLFTCMDCRKTFTFARATYVEDWLNTMARADLISSGIKQPSRNSLKEREASLKMLLDDVVRDQLYVYLDGKIIPADATNIEFKGLHSRHSFKKVPQVEALTDPSILTDVLSNRKYWERTACR